MIGSVNHCIYFYNKTLIHKKTSNNNKTHVVTDSPAMPSTYTWSQLHITYYPHMIPLSIHLKGLLTPFLHWLVLRLQALHWSCHLPAGFLTHSGRPPPVFTTKRGKIFAQSWRPCLPGQPWASGWRSTDRPVPSPRGWTIVFSERGAAHNRALPRCLSSRRCMRSWRVRGWPLSRPEAARPPPPSSLPSMAEWPGGTRAFPRWRERSRCTCAHETPPLGGTVRVSRPRPVSWQPLSRPKLTVLRARQPPPCMPWLSCRFTKPRRSNRCTRVVPTRGWCRSCARRLTSLYERRKSRRGPSGRRCPPWWSRSAISGSTWQRWRTSTRHAFSTPPSPREGCSATPSRASPSSSRRYSSRPRRSSTSCPGVMHHPPLPPGPGLGLPVAVGALLRPPEPLRPRPNRHIGRCVEPLAGERRPPRPSQAPSRPGNRRSGPDAGNPEMLEFALSQETARTAPLLPPVEGREENLLFRLVSVPPLVQGPSQRKSKFLFLRVLRSMGRQCAMPCLLTLAHDPFCQ